LEKTTDHIKVPRDISRMLLADEAVLLAVKQSRWKALFTPDTILVTSQRVIRYSPWGFLGLRRDIVDYRFEDMANFKASHGLLFAKLTIGHRFMSENLVLEHLPKGRVADISRLVGEHIGRARGSMTSIQIPQAQPPQDALGVLRMRFARGEITKEQFEEMKRTLG
jgi:hypothetical protein